MNEDTIPLEAGIEDRAISFTKGCYVGQEVIVRVTHRGGGRVAKRLVRWKAGAFAPNVPAGEARILVRRSRHRPRHQRRVFAGSERHRRPRLRAPRFRRCGTEVTVVWNDARVEGAIVPMTSGFRTAAATLLDRCGCRGRDRSLRRASSRHTSPSPQAAQAVLVQGQPPHPHAQQRRRLDAGRCRDVVSRARLQLPRAHRSQLPDQRRRA